MQYYVIYIHFFINLQRTHTILRKSIKQKLVFSSQLYVTGFLILMKYLSDQPY